MCTERRRCPAAPRVPQWWESGLLASSAETETSPAPQGATPPPPPPPAEEPAEEEPEV